MWCTTSQTTDGPLYTAAAAAVQFLLIRLIRPQTANNTIRPNKLSHPSLAAFRFFCLYFLAPLFVVYFILARPFTHTHRVLGSLFIYKPEPSAPVHRLGLESRLITRSIDLCHSGRSPIGSDARLSLDNISNRSFFVCSIFW